MNSTKPERLPKPSQHTACDIVRCEARCCYDGVYLQEGEETRLREIVASAPGFFKSVHDEFIVDGSWGGRVSGRKTAVAEHVYAAPNLPAHFNKTRCTFCSDDHRCLLQALAVDRGRHKWAYKPQACWAFPLRIVNARLIPPPGPTEPDPDCLGEDYPGYVKFVPCGQPRPEGPSWEELFTEEIAYWRATNVTGLGATEEPGPA